jgi:hypothetical protein
MPLMVTDSEVEQLMAEAFHPLPVPAWWAGVETGEGLTVWTVVEADALQPNRWHALTELREMLEELAEMPCVIHAYEKPPTKRQAKMAVKRLARRW